MGRLGGISSSSSSHSRKSPRIQPPCPHAPRVLFAPITSPLCIVGSIACYKRGASSTTKRGQRLKNVQPQKFMKEATG